MRNLKKVLALVIAFSMMLSVVAFAGYNDVDADADYAGAVELLSALGIFEGDDQGNFNPDKTVTRAEMAAIICRATGLEEMAEASKGEVVFADVPASHWASGYIKVAKENEIIDGVGGGNFAPDATLTYPQAVKMIVYALGFEPMAKDNGGWSAGSIYVANKYKISEGAAVNATRGNLAILLANAMTTPVMDKAYTADSDYEILNGKGDKDYATLLTAMDIYVATGVVGAKDADEIAFEIKEDSEDGKFDVSKKANYNFKIGASDIADYEDQQVDAYVKEYSRGKFEVVAVVSSVVGETLTILSDDIEDVDGNKVSYFIDAINSNKTKKFEVEDNLKIRFNTVDYEGSLADFEDDEDVILTFIENDANDKFDVLVAKYYTSCRVEDVDADADRLFLADGTIKFDFDAAEDGDVTYILADEDGNALTLNDFAKDDVVAYISDKNIGNRTATYVEIIKLSNAAVTGAVSEAYELNGKQYVVIDGTDYVDGTGELDATAEGTFYIGLTGKIIEFDATLAGENYGYIVEGAKAQGSFSADKWQIKILTKADGIVTYDITEKYHDTVVKYLNDNAAAFNIENDKFLFEDATAAEKANVARLITFATNSKGEIRELVAAEGTTKDLESKEYNADAQSINGAALENDVVVFLVGEDDIDAIKAADISYLVDESEYEGYALRDEDGEYAVMVITGADAAYNVDAGFAVVTKISTGKDADGDAVTKVSYVQNGEEAETDLILSYGDKTKCLNKEDEELAVGDAFMFVADADGLVSKYTIVAGIEYDEDNKITGFEVYDNFLDAEVAGDKLGKDTEIVLGYIFNQKPKRNNGKQIIYLDAAEQETISVPAAAYQYTYNAVNPRNHKIVTGTFMEDVEWYDAEAEKAAPVLFRVIDGVVVDAYGLTEAQVVAE